MRETSDVMEMAAHWFNSFCSRQDVIDEAVRRETTPLERLHFITAHYDGQFREYVARNVRATFSKIISDVEEYELAGSGKGMR